MKREKQPLDGRFPIQWAKSDMIRIKVII